MILSKTRILLAEDDNRARRLMEQYLTSWGYEVVAVSDGLEALRALEQQDAPPLALIDWVMPGMEGIEVCRQVRQEIDRLHTLHTYIILLTAKTDKEAVAAGLEAGADDYLTKPCDVVELRARLLVGQRMLNLEYTLARQVVALQESLDQVRQLKGLLPMCAWCKRVRDDEDYWHNIEEYLHEHTGTDFTHGICPHCLEEERAKLKRAS